MDYVRKYKYAIGTMNTLKEGNLTNLPNSEKLEELEVDFSSDEIIIPRFVGVYQTEEAALSLFEDKEDKESIDRGIALFGGIVSLVSGLSLLNRNSEIDDFNPNLIYAGYDRACWPNAGAIRRIYEIPERIGVSVWTEMPRFQAKRIDFLRALLSDINTLREKGISDDSIFCREGKRVEFAIREMYPFGLTIAEYAVLDAMKSHLARVKR